MSRFRPRQVTVRKPLSKVDQALRIAKSNKKKIHDTREMDNTDQDTGALTLNATPVVLYIIPSSANTGNKVSIKSFQLRGVVKQNLSSAIIDDYRIDLVLDRRPDKAAITPLLYLRSATPRIDAYKDFDEKERYRIIKTWSGYLSSSEGSNSFRKINYYTRLNYFAEGDNGVSQTTITKNALYIVFWTTASANQPTFQAEFSIVSVHE